MNEESERLWLEIDKLQKGFVDLLRTVGYKKPIRIKDKPKILMEYKLREYLEFLQQIQKENADSILNLYKLRPPNYWTYLQSIGSQVEDVKWLRALCGNLSHKILNYKPIKTCKREVFWRKKILKENPDADNTKEFEMATTVEGALLLMAKYFPKREVARSSSVKDHSFKKQKRIDPRTGEHYIPGQPRNKENTLVVKPQQQDITTDPEAKGWRPENV